MQKISALALLALSVMFPLTIQAQDQAEMADVMRSNGKIYVIVGIILVVLAGLVIYLFSIDRKIGKLEKKLENASKTK